MLQPSFNHSSVAGYQKVAKDYDKGRPDYPQEAITTFTTQLGIQANKIVLDLAAGTGKLTKALTLTKARFIAVEPVAGMRDIFSVQFPNIPILHGSAEAIPLHSQSVDIVTVGTAFHWFDGEKALVEIARVLKPKGKLGLIWNIFDADVDWVKKVRSILEKDAKGEISTHDFKKWQTAFVHSKLFLPLQHQTVRYSYQGTVEDVIDRVFSAKVMGMLSENERAEMVTQVKAILATHPDTTGKTTFAIPYRVEIYWTELR